MVVYKGKKAVCGIQLTIDRVWRYAMTNSDILTVSITDETGETINTICTNDNVDSIDKQVTVVFAAEDTAKLSEGYGTISAVMNDLVVLSPTTIEIKEV